MPRSIIAGTRPEQCLSKDGYLYSTSVRWQNPSIALENDKMAADRAVLELERWNFESVQTYFLIFENFLKIFCRELWPSFWELWPSFQILHALVLWRYCNVGHHRVGPLWMSVHLYLGVMPAAQSAARLSLLQFYRCGLHIQCCMWWYISQCYSRSCSC